MADIVVLNHGVHGIPAAECVDALRERVDDRSVTLAESAAAERELVPDAEVIVGSDLDADLLELADDLRLFACTSAGTDRLDMDAFRERGVAVTSASGVHGPNIAEHVIGTILMITRRLDEGLRRQERAEWRHFQAFGELQGSRICVVGLGAIGTAVVERLEGFGVETVGVRYTPEKGGPTDEVYGFDELLEAFVGVDYVVVACPLTETTQGLIGGDELAALPVDAVLVNIARGPVVDTDALVTALRKNDLHAAALDVTDPEPLPADHPLWSLGNAYVTSHVSGYTPRYLERVADILSRNLDRVDETGSYADLENRVD
ncbi:D-2-hydroxyacid dehydrogenase [Haloparvum sedimenti]|uniref:D-2-hydroxyacid dehydrogenase n=1 Tax=Haloparvum sedimenti TaxID=1678448 RepID=UPI00071E8789|nr:D-2-hydroxyacid dehydrogenase [Haloparvum sedimenti]